MADSARPLRHCDVCNQVDDHPRHVHSPDLATAGGSDEQLNAILDLDLEPGVRGRIVRELTDPTTHYRHMDCCRAVGCPDGSCNDKPALTGQALIDHLTKEG